MRKIVKVRSNGQITIFDATRDTDGKGVPIRKFIKALIESLK